MNFNNTSVDNDSILTDLENFDKDGILNIVEDLDDRLTDANDTIEEHKNTIEDFEDRVHDLESRVKDLTAENEELEEKIRDLS